MSNRVGQPPQRFRRRLTLVCIGLAAISAGVVAAVTFILAREYRWRNFRNTSVQEARVALAFAPNRLDARSFDRLRATYDARSDADMLAVTPADHFASVPTLSIGDVPPALRSLSRTAAPAVTEARVDGRSTLVVGAAGPDGTRYYFFFSLAQLQDSLNELARVAFAAWVITVIVAGLIGRVVAKATLRPVGTVATAAEAIAGGDLSTRLLVGSDDEFGVLAQSFNHMADEVEELVSRLRDAATRERRFTADVAHELRTPLTGLSVTATVLEDELESLPTTARKAASVLIGDVTRLRNLVLELLELARLDAGADPVRNEPLRVREAIKAVVRESEVRRRANIAIDVTDETVVLAEPERLGRILGNLIDNALTHGGGQVQVAARRTGSTTIIEVDDQGPGIPASQLPHLFDRFYKSDSSRAGEGSGLGLAIAREHAVSLGGDLQAENRPDGGMRFTVMLSSAARRQEADDAGSY